MYYVNKIFIRLLSKLFEPPTYFNYVPIRDVSHDSDDTSPDADTEIVQPLNEEAVYLISGKFSPNQDSSLNVVVTTSICLPIDKEDIPICQPIVHLLGKTLNNAELSETGYNLNVQVKPYLSKDYFNPFTIALTHPSNGRFHNALTKAKKNSTIHTTGILFSIKNNFYCEIMEFQFIATKQEANTNVVVPWKLEDTEKSASQPKSTLEKRIALIQQNQSTQSLPTKTMSSAKRKNNPIKIAEISKSILLQSTDDLSNNNGPVTSEQGNVDNEEITKNTRKRRKTK